MKSLKVRLKEENRLLRHLLDVERFESWAERVRGNGMFNVNTQRHPYVKQGHYPSQCEANIKLG